MSAETQSERTVEEQLRTLTEKEVLDGLRIMQQADSLTKDMDYASKVGEMEEKQALQAIRSRFGGLDGLLAHAADAVVQKYGPLSEGLAKRAAKRAWSDAELYRGQLASQDALLLRGEEGLRGANAELAAAKARAAQDAIQHKETTQKGMREAAQLVDGVRTALQTGDPSVTAEEARANVSRAFVASPRRITPLVMC